METWDYSQATPPRQELKIVSPCLLLATLQCDFVGDNPYTIPQAEAEANARLFAASKDLLKACEELLLYIRADNELKVIMYPQSLEFAAHVIAKAKGVRL